MNSRTSGRLAFALVAMLGASGLFAAEAVDTAAGKKININQASAKELANLPRIGAKVADRGFLYILFFLGMISVNLAVINFLPMPIVDGGLFLFLIYEKFKGKPPPLAFQNAATIVGLCMIGALFLITFYNDVMRLLS